MAIDFILKDVMHQIVVKFTPAYLPEAEKQYYLKAVLQPEVNVHELASKAEVYNIETDPKVIEEGFLAACELSYYLAADGYRIKTPLFNLRARMPGEYNGSETGLAEGKYPEVRMQPTARLREYIRDKVKVSFDGIDNADGLIAEAVDEKTGHSDEVATIGNFLTIHGYGLKIESDKDHELQMGLFFQGPSGTIPVKTELVAINEPRTLKVVVPALTAGTEYNLRLFTMSSPRKGEYILKTVRDMKSEFKLTAQA
jgi:hypothetical protein